MNTTKQGTYSHQAHIAHSSTAPFLASDPHWLDEFRTDINMILSQVDQRFNRLVAPNAPLLSSSEQIKLLNELIGFIRNVQITCSYIQSALIVDKQRELKNYADQLIVKSQSNSTSNLGESREILIRLLYDTLVTLISYIQTYCHAYLIPYEVEIYNEENASIELDKFKYPLSSKPLVGTPLSKSSELFSVFVDSLFCLPSQTNIKTIRIAARLCYGNATKARQISAPMSFARHHFHSENVALKPQVRFHQWLLFDDARLCELSREALLLFEVYASYIDELDGSTPHELFDGVPMRLIGWCSQALFDHDNQLITGERYLGIFDSLATHRTGFYSLRNVFDRHCLILGISFLDQNYFWPDVQPRDDLQAGKFAEISREKQENLSRLLRRPSLLLMDHVALVHHDARKSIPSINSDEGTKTKNIFSHYRFVSSFQTENFPMMSLISSGHIDISSSTNRTLFQNSSSRDASGIIRV